MSVLAFKNVGKRYGERVALTGVTFELHARQKIAVVGRSGSGKSTLLHLAAGIDVASEGSVEIDGRPLGGMSDRERTRLRRDRIGLVFQFFYLLPHLTVFENVALPSLIAGDSRTQFAPRVTALLDAVGLADRAEDLTPKLSGGEMQRVAICRALLRKPALLLADEPTGNLDDENGRVVLNLLFQLSAQEGSSVLFVTHSAELAAQADAIWHIHSGQLSP